ncbi:MAG: two-component regulator propeller domain-containing protein [Candidatus Gracilibacteria bacterium]|nr:two-component regulator propeller domain-containing protein [Candidatus Gracilibacteria bacterium]
MLKGKYFKYKGFTLAELLVTMAIFIILGLIAFLCIDSYTKNARDSVRISDMKGIQKILGLYIIQRGLYPEPTKGKDVLYEGARVWTQGVFGDPTFSNVKIINKKPIDPLRFIEYTYSVTSDRQEYQLVGVLENPENITLKNSFVKSANAYENNVSFSLGTYNGLLARCHTGGLDYFLALPSIVSNDLSSLNLVDIISNKSLVYNKYSNLPSNFSGVYDVDNNFNFMPNNLLLYTGSIRDFIDSSKQIDLLRYLQDSYSGTIVIADDDMVEKITEMYIDINSPSGKAKALACNIVNFNLRYFVKCSDLDFITFYIISVLHLDITKIPGTVVSSIFQSTDGGLRFGTDAGVVLYDGENWTTYDKFNSGLVHNMVWAISQDTSGDMWFGTNLGISKFDGTNWVTLNTKNSGLLNNHILQIYTGTDGKMWIGTNNGVNSYDSGVWEDYTKKKTGISHDHVTSIYEDNYGNIWFGTDVGLDKYSNGVVTSYTTSDGLPTNKITFITQDLNDNLWVGTTSGLVEYNWSTFTTKNTLNTSGGLPSNYIKYIYQDKNNGDLWVGTDNGATKYVRSLGTWTVYNTSTGLSGNDIEYITQNIDGNILIVNDGGADVIN